MANFLLLLASRFAAVVKAYFSRVGGDGGTTVNKQHAQEVYTDTNPYDPTLIQSCDSGKATVLYNIVPNNSDFTVDRNSTKYVLGSGGTIVSYPTDEPAFEFNTDGTYKGLLVEPAATNICLQSENLSTTWVFNEATTTQSTEETPDGDTTNKYIKLVDDGGGGTSNNSYVKQSLTVSGGTKYTASVFVKADGVSFVRLQMDGTGLGDPYQSFGLSGSGSLGTASGLDDSSIEAYPNGWYRCSITWTQGAGDTFVELRIRIASSLTSITIPRDGTSSIFVWGAQVELGPIATSYMPTTTGSVTRVKDDITLGSASSLIGQTEGTLYVEVDWRASGTFQKLLVVSDGTTNNRMLIYNSSGSEIRMLAQANGIELTNQGVSSAAYSGIQKIAFAYANNDFELYRNGSSISSDTVGILAALATMTDIDLGQGYNAAGQANMHIRAVAIYPTRLSDAECEALTTL